jgi:hypothetical protein
MLSYVFSLIDLCNNKKVQYHDQSIIILESEAATINRMDAEVTSPMLCPNFFDKNKVSRILAIKRPNESVQIHVADGLHRKYHFSCLTRYVPSLFEEIRARNNNNLQILFIPHVLKYFKNEVITIFNDLSIGNTFSAEESKTLNGAVLDSGGGTQSTSSGKRSNFSTSVGLQTMYSHEQHRARCSMLPHSKPHALTVRNKYPPILIKSIMRVYKYILSILDKGNGEDRMS